MDSTLQILEKVNALYSGAFGHLLTITLSILAFSGVILPIVVQLIQTRMFRTEQKSLEVQIAAKIETASNRLKTDFEQVFETEKKNLQEIVKREVEELNNRFTVQLSAAKGASFFLQARNLMERDLYGQAARDFAFAADMLFKGADEGNSQRAISQLRVCIPKLYKETFEEVVDLEENLAGLLETLRNNNKNNRFLDTINGLTSEMQTAKRKSRPSPPAPASQGADEKG